MFESDAVSGIQPIDTGMMPMMTLAVEVNKTLLWQLVSVAAVLTALATWFWTRRALRDCGLEQSRTPQVCAMLGGLIGGVFTFLMMEYSIQEIPEVRPTWFWLLMRIPYHLLLMTGLLAVTATDFREFYISTRVTNVGTILGLLLATVSGDLQICHVWVDWNQEIPQIQGPYLPAWLSVHPHLHGLAWSAAGALTGVILAAVVRLLGNVVLARPTLGSGDVHLMAMIGATLGWQPTVVAFLLAPLCAILIGAFARLVLNRPALPYGPFLAAGALIVLFSWKWIWMFEVQLAEGTSPDDRLATFAVRRFFGDPVSMGAVTGIAVGGFVVLLGLLRLYYMIPVKGTDSNTIH